LLLPTVPKELCATSELHEDGNIIQLIKMFNFIYECRLTRVNPDCKVRYLPHPRPVDNCLAKITKVSSSNGY
jgi:ent-kaurenoic acid hydroxylase